MSPTKSFALAAVCICAMFSVTMRADPTPAERVGEIQKALDKLAAKDAAIRSEFTKKQIRTADFAKKLMGQIVFLYFIQKKGWLGVAKGQDWGTGPHDFLRRRLVTQRG